MRLPDDLDFNFKKEIEERALKLDESIFVRLDKINFEVIKRLVINKEELDELNFEREDQWIILLNCDTYEPLSSTEYLSGEECAIVNGEKKLLKLAVMDFLSLIALEPPYSVHFLRVASQWLALARRNRPESDKAIWLEFHYIMRDNINNIIEKIESITEKDWNILVSDIYKY